MAGHCLDKLPHHCGSRDGLQVFERDDGSVDGYCFSCNTFVRHPYDNIEKKASDLPKPKIKTQEEINQEIEEIQTYPTVDITKKKLRKQTLQEFGVRVGLSPKDGKTPYIICYP